MLSVCRRVVYQTLVKYYKKWFFVRKIYRNGSRSMRHVSVISEHSIFTGFHGLTGFQRDPRDRGVTAWYQSIDIRIPRALGTWV